MNPDIPFLIALDLDAIVWVIVVVIWFLGFLVKIIKGGAKGGAKANVRRADGQRVRTEIESFLEEISAKQTKRPPEKPVPQPPARSRPPVAKTSKKSTTPSKAPRAEGDSKKSQRQVGKLSDKHLSSSNLGQGVRSHVTAFVQSETIAASVQEDLKDKISAEVQADLGQRPSISQPVSSSRSVHPLITFLRSPQGVRQAIIMQEVLQRPKTLRRQP